MIQSMGEKNVIYLPQYYYVSRISQTFGNLTRFEKLENYNKCPPGASSTNMD